MRSNALVKIFGYRATLIHGDTLVLDRWRWLQEKLKGEDKRKKILDIGCGTGAFSIGLAKKGFNTTGLTWDRADTEMAMERARIAKATSCKFEIQDARRLDERKDFLDAFDIAICTENIEHILNDQKLVKDIAGCLKRGGKLLLTTPNIDFKAITKIDDAPLETVEMGGHVKRGYSKAELENLCAQANLDVIEIGFVSGFFSQKVTGIWRTLNKVNPILSFGLTLPLRTLPVIFDRFIPYTGFSITLVAEKRA